MGVLMSKTAMVFPGQGSQVVGMAKDLYDRHASVQAMYRMASDILGFDLARVSFDGPESDLKQTRVTQPAIFVHSCAVMMVLRETRDVVFDMTAGHSLGEYSALVAANVMSFEDALKVVGIRASAMQEAGEKNKGTMAAVIGMDAEQLGKICCQAYTDGVVQCANYNSPGQIVISGSVEGVGKAMTMAKEQGARMVKELVVSGAFHSPLMASAREKVAEALETVILRDAARPVFPNVTATAETRGSTLKNLLIEQITAPVKWHESVINMTAAGATRFFEIGPGNVLSGLIKRIDSNVTCACIGKADELSRYV
jgi:[acyl-carrier-protein] S-malonyltransferase